MIGLLCKGSTTDFDSVCLGSNPSNPTKKSKPRHLPGFFILPIPCYLNNSRFKVNKIRRHFLPIFAIKF